MGKHNQKKIGMHTESDIINRDWSKLKKKHGSKWAIKYFKAADKLFNPNKMKVIRYQYSGLVTMQADGSHLFHAITDIGSKQGPRVAFSMVVDKK
jgi:hypothetical protein